MNNRLKELLAAGQTAVGAMVRMPSAPAVEVLAQCGFDWLVIDAEHGPIDIETLHAMIGASRGTATTPAVRVSSNLDWLTKRALDAGALAVMIPGVNNAAQAQAAVRPVRYPPQGDRGFGPTFAGLRWNLSADAYARAANDAVMAIVQIEHVDAVENIDEILAVPGVDLALIGPYDLSGSMGRLGELTHPEVQAAIQRVLQAAQKAKVPAGIFGATAEEINRYISQGFRAILAGVDVGFLASGARSILNEIKR